MVSRGFTIISLLGQYIAKITRLSELSHHQFITSVDVAEVIVVRNSINHLTMEPINIISFVQIHCHKMDYFAQQSPRHYLYLYGTTSLCFTAKTCLARIKFYHHQQDGPKGFVMMFRLSTLP